MDRFARAPKKPVDAWSVKGRRRQREKLDDQANLLGHGDYGWRRTVQISGTPGDAQPCRGLSNENSRSVLVNRWPASGLVIGGQPQPARAARAPPSMSESHQSGL